MKNTLWIIQKQKGSLGPCHNNIIFLGANGNLIACHDPYLYNRSIFFFDGPNALPIEHET